MESQTLSVGIPVALAAADFDGDGMDEMVIASASGETLLVYQISPDDSLAQIAEAGPAYDVTGLAVADLNVDGHLDFVFSTSGTPGAIVVFAGRADLSFDGPFEFLANEALVDITVGDFNGDGIPDAAGAGASSISLVVSTPTN